MSTAKISADKPLPVFVTNPAPNAATIPSDLGVGTKWEVRQLDNPEKLTIEKLEGSWAHCSLISDPTELFWTNLAGSQFHGWFPYKS